MEQLQKQIQQLQQQICTLTSFVQQQSQMIHMLTSELQSLREDTSNLQIKTEHGYYGEEWTSITGVCSYDIEHEIVEDLPYYTVDELTDAIRDFADDLPDQVEEE